MSINISKPQKFYQENEISDDHMEEAELDYMISTGSSEIGIVEPIFFSEPNEEESAWEDELSPRSVAEYEVEDMVKLFFHEATRVPLLKAEEEIELARRIEMGVQAQKLLENKKMGHRKAEELHRLVESGNSARDHLIRANIRLVISIAKKYIGRGLPLLDLIQEGVIGLMRATRNYDYHRGFRFSTYATYWIRQGVQRAITTQGRTIRIPVYMGEQINKMLHAQNQFQQRMGRPPTTQELSAVVGMPPEKLEQMKEIVKTPISLQTPISDDEEETIGNIIEDEEAQDPEEAASQAISNEDLKTNLEALPHREKEVLKLRYGLNGDSPLTLQETGRRLGITRERARQLETSALKHLRMQSRIYEEAISERKARRSYLDRTSR